MLSIGANNTPCTDGTTPIHHAVGTGHWPIVKVLMQYGADPTYALPYGRTLLISEPNFNIFPSTPDFINIQDNTGQTAHFHAICHRSPTHVQKLFSHGIDVSIRDVARLDT